MASAQGKACASANAHAGASIFRSAGVRANANASASALLPSCPWFWRGLHPGTLEFQDPVSGVAYARLGPRFGVSGDRLHGLSALQLALLSCSKGVTQWLPSQ